ncbi:site-specific DNA-methyltransferase [Brevundimonas bullata]|uniref:site-specific DNA-methyltransferase n=1 Tax=Brevundimonas bullata TaxID=13160 RepID=UPI000E0BB61C|nr:site-specific DNA-methyltransferase [Brevundimonas bullata]WQE37094.1 site-specific DNA-methyltransferase [Brevundimonas bullata]
MTNQPIQFAASAVVAANDNLPATTPPPAAPSVRLLKGECIDTMSAMTAESVDLVITSPPYLNIGMPYGDAFATIEDYIEFSRQWITAAARVLKPGAAMWINVGMHKAGPNSRVPLTYYLFPLIAGTGLTFVQEIVWDRRAHQRTTQRFSTRSERWLYLVKPGTLKGARGRPKNIDPVFNLEDVRIPCQSADKRNNLSGANPSDIWAFTQVHGTSKERTAHPCPFPQAMIERIVLACSNPGNVVLDPFGGSGTTGAASMAHGRSAVMIEREPTYWPIIEKRLGLKEEEKPATVLNGDCLSEMAKMADGSVPMIFTSPPYNLREGQGGFPTRKGKWNTAKLREGYDGHNDAMPYEDYVAWQKAFLLECWRLIPEDGAIFYQHKHRVQHGVLRTPHDLNPSLPLRQIIVWDRGSGMNFNRNFATPSHEVIHVFAKPKFRFRKGHGLKDVIKVLPDRRNPHPAPFPVEVPRLIIAATDAKMVLDPFCGSGSTGVAALKEGRKFVGIEQSADYCRMAEDRLGAMRSEDREKVGSGDVANDNAARSDGRPVVKPVRSEASNDNTRGSEVIRYGTVCSGIDGVSLAWEPLGGFKPAFFSEIERFPSAVLNHHWPAVPNLGNMLDIDGADWRGKLDVLWGSSPCQSFSRTGKRLGMADARGELTRKFVDLADEIDPEFIILENVKGLLSDKRNAFGCYLGALVGASDPLLCREKRWPNFGYVTGVRRHVAWRVLDAQHGGVAQHRERVFVVGCPRNGPDPREVLFEQASEGRHSETAAGKARHREAQVATRLGHRRPAIYLNADATPKWAVEQSYTLRAAGGSGGKACVVVDGKVREIIPEEREGLMGIPVGHTNIPWPGKARSLDVARYKAIGNSLAIPDVRWLGERIKLARAIHRAGINLPLAA